MKLLQQNHLRIITPVTTDGVNLAYDSFKQPKVIISILPVSALKHIQLENQNLPEHLKHKIEHVSAPEPVKERVANNQPISEPKKKVSKKAKVEHSNQDDE